MPQTACARLWPVALAPLVMTTRHGRTVGDSWCRVICAVLMQQDIETWAISLGHQPLIHQPSVQDLLGDTLAQIATEKGGIFKPGVPAFTVQQPKEAMEALQLKAAEVGTPLTVVRPWENYANAVGVRLGLAGEHQKTNAALALALVGAWEAASGRGPAAIERAAAVAAGTIPPEYAAGLEAAAWPGRGQVVHDYESIKPDCSGSDSGDGAAAATAGKEDSLALVNGSPCQQQLPRLSFYLDGAHTPESMLTCGQWFADAVGTSSSISDGDGSSVTDGSAPNDGLVTQRVLLFNCMQEREPAKLLAPLVATLAERHVPMHHALFVPPESQYFKVGAGGMPDAAPVDLSWQNGLRAVWDGLAPGARAAAEPSTRVPLPLLPAAGPAAAAGATSSAVLPNLRVTLDWLRHCMREVPKLRMQVCTHYCLCEGS